ncbi:hypothetical protein HMPREF9534_04643, partial [Escherichia coli MS 69-1]
MVAPCLKSSFNKLRAKSYRGAMSYYGRLLRRERDEMHRKQKTPPKRG